jgi:hypothetical protein
MHKSSTFVKMRRVEIAAIYVVFLTLFKSRAING